MRNRKRVDVGETFGASLAVASVELVTEEPFEECDPY
jgi:hypothetical protein